MILSVEMTVPFDSASTASRFRSNGDSMMLFPDTRASVGPSRDISNIANPNHLQLIGHSPQRSFCMRLCDSCLIVAVPTVLNKAVKRHPKTAADRQLPNDCL